MNHDVDDIEFSFSRAFDAFKVANVSLQAHVARRINSKFRKWTYPVIAVPLHDVVDGNK